MSGFPIHGMSFAPELLEPDFRGLVVRTNSAKAREHFSLVVEFAYRHAIAITANQTVRSISFPSGAVIRFVGVPDFDTAEAFRGQEFNRIEFPDLGQYADGVVMCLMQQIRRSRGRPPRAAVLGDIYPVESDPVAAFHRKQALHEALVVNRAEIWQRVREQEQAQARAVAFDRAGWYFPYGG